MKVPFFGPWGNLNWNFQRGSSRVSSRVLPCPPGKNSYARDFKGKHSQHYISLERLINEDFGKKYELPVF